jgi:hypothetical protein
MTAMVRPQRDHELRQNGLGAVFFGLDVGLGNTIIPVGEAFTPLKLWALAADLFRGGGIEVLANGTVIRTPRNYWGFALGITTVIGTDITGGGGAAWELAIGLGADLVEEPGEFLIPPPPLVSPTTALDDRLELNITTPNLAPNNSPLFDGLTSYDVAVLARHGNVAQRTFSPSFASLTYVRLALLGNPLSG